MEHSVFGYHQSKRYVNPDENKLGDNIKGLELEISDSRAYVHNTLDELIEKNILTAPYNAEDGNAKICIENDGSVFKELIFKADKQRNVLKELKKLNEGGLNPNNIKNHRGTSAHIHMNRRYLESLDVYELDMTKATEFMLNVAFMTSGRDYDRMSEWARSTLPCEVDADLFTRAKFIDRIDDVSYNRYNALNLNPSNSIELRIFSNYCSFDYNTIKYFLEFSDKIIEIAEIMKGKKYTEDGEMAIDIMEDYFKKYKRREAIYNKYHLNNVICNYTKLKELNKIKIWNEIEQRINRFRNYIEHENKTNNTMELIRLLRHIDEVQGIKLSLTINMREPQFDNILSEIENQVKNELNL